MQKVTVLCVGKLKEAFYAAAVAEYQKRLQRHCKLEIVELPEQKLPESPAPAEIEQALAREAALIEEKLPKGGAVIALCIEGTELSSEAALEKAGAARLRGRFAADLSHRRQLRPAPAREAARRPAPFHVAHDLPAPSGAGDAARADLPRVPDQRRHALS